MHISGKNEYTTPVQLRGRVKTAFAATSIFYPFMIGIISYASLCSLAKVYTNKRWIKSSAGLRKYLELSGVEFEINGIENIWKLKSPAVFIANHMSTLETFILPGIIEPVRHVTFIVKKSLITYPVFGPVMRSRDPVVVSRENPREDFSVVMTDGVKKLSGGTSIVVFPQATRSVEFKPEEFNSLGVKLAKRAGAPVVPIALKTDAWSNGSVLKDYGPIYPDRKVHIAFGSPMEISGTGAQEQKIIVAFIQEHLAVWKKNDL